MPRPISVLGQRFGRLVVIEDDTMAPARSKRTVRCRCDCGTECHPSVKNLKAGWTNSCGCLHAPHSESYRITPEYRAWKAMKNRCGDKRRAEYGQRGISVCERWRTSFAAFLSDMGRRPTPAHSLDRYPDNDGDYEPGNVRWATAKEQALNRRAAVANSSWFKKGHIPSNKKPQGQGTASVKPVG